MRIWERVGWPNGKYIRVILTRKQAIISCYPNDKLRIYSFERGTYGYKAACVWAGPVIPNRPPSFEMVAAAWTERTRYNPRIAERIVDG